MYLKIDNIKKSYGTGDSRVDVLKGINCGVNKGEICVLLGPSGSGKSTLLNILGGIDKADGGSVTIGEDKSKTLMINSSLNIGANISDIYSSRITLFLI